MPNGDILFSRITPSMRMRAIKFLDSQVGSHSGVWKDMRGFSNSSFTINSLEVGGTVEVHVSNQETEPSSGQPGPIIAFTMIPTAKSGILNAPYHWAKAVKKAGASAIGTNCITEGTG